MNTCAFWKDGIGQTKGETHCKDRAWEYQHAGQLLLLQALPQPVWPEVESSAHRKHARPPLLEAFTFLRLYLPWTGNCFYMFLVVSLSLFPGLITILSVGPSFQVCSSTQHTELAISVHALVRSLWDRIFGGRKRHLLPVVILGALDCTCARWQSARIWKWTKEQVEKSIIKINILFIISTLHLFFPIPPPRIERNRKTPFQGHLWCLIHACWKKQLTIAWIRALLSVPKCKPQVNTKLQPVWMFYIVQCSKKKFLYIYLCRNRV